MTNQEDCAPTTRLLHVLKSVLLLLCMLAAVPLAGEEPPPVHASNSLRPALALALVEGAQAACRAQDFQVTVVVVDRAGIPQAALRDQLAGNFTWDIATAKARTAAGFRQPTLGLARQLPKRPELETLHQIDTVMMVGGGVPISYEGAVVGAIGVSGAPTQEADHACAEAGIEAISDALLF